jgi:hypothetical protein
MQGQRKCLTWQVQLIQRDAHKLARCKWGGSSVSMDHAPECAQASMPTQRGCTGILWHVELQRGAPHVGLLYGQRQLIAIIVVMNILLSA